MQEVQVMQMTEESRDKRIVVAFNPMTEDIMEMIQENKVSIKDCVKKILSKISDKKVKGKKKAGADKTNLSKIPMKMKKRLRRHCSKLQREDSLTQQLLEFSLVESIENIQLDKIPAGCINVLFWQNYETAKLRHAEEFLCDVAEKIRESQPEFKFAIYGKRRPCMSCSGRMETSEIDYYNLHPGYLWLHGIKYQSEEAARNTLKLLLTKLSCVTYEGDQKMSDYDTGSDTEPEDLGE